MTELSKETEEKIQQLQMMEQNMQNFLSQKQTFQVQLVEITSALEELEKVEKAYKIVGNIIIQEDSKKLQEDLKQKKEITELRIKNIEKQEDKIKKKAAELQADVLKEMK